MSWLNINGNWIGRHSGKSWQTYWTSLISATIENAAPTDVVLTFPTARTTLGASDFTIAGFTISSASWTGAVLTLVLSTAVVYGDVLIITLVTTGGTANVTNNIAIEDETTALIARMTNPPSSDRIVLYNNLIRSGKSHGWWAVGDVMVITAAHDSQAALLNIIKDAHNGTLVGTPYFELDRGFQFSRAGQIETDLSYIDSNYAPKTEGVNFLQNSASFIIGNLSLIAVSGLGCNTGVEWGSQTKLIIGNTVSSRVFINGSAGVQPPVVSRKCYFGGIRRNSTTVKRCENLTISDDIASDSATIATGNIFIGAQNNETGATLGGEDKYNFYFIGGALSDVQYTWLITDVEAYMHGVGAGILAETPTGNILNPYNQVFKVTALTDSVFKWNVNKAFFYTRQDIWDAIANMPSSIFPEDMDSYTKIKLFLDANSGGYYDITKNNDACAEILRFLNSYAQGTCFAQAIFSRNIMEHYYPGKTHIVEKSNHTTWNIEDQAWGDTFTKETIYKNKYVPATMEEIQADLKLLLEPIRKTSPTGHWDSTYLAEWHFEDYDEVLTHEGISTDDNLLMKLPSGGSFVYPVKSADSLKAWDDTELPEETCNLIVTLPAGVIGEVEMPCLLQKITGTGSVILNSITYNLPDDEAALEAVIQLTPTAYAITYNSFTVLTNTDGISAEYLANLKRALLFRHNDVETGIISGSIFYEPVDTDIPIKTTELSVYKGDNDLWNINYQKSFTENMNCKVPYYAHGSQLHYIVFGGTKRSPTKWFMSQSPEVTQRGLLTKIYISEIVPATPVYDTCFAAKLTPTDDSFSGSLELSFTNFDDSDTYYTTDGTTPDATKTLYTEPFTISATTTVKWINIKEDYADSHVNSRTITKT